MVVQRAPGVCSLWDLQVYTPTSVLPPPPDSGMEFTLPNHFSSSLSNFFFLSLPRSKGRAFPDSESHFLTSTFWFQVKLGSSTILNPLQTLPVLSPSVLFALVPWAQHAQLPLSYLGRKTQQWCLVHFKKFVVSSLKWTVNAAQQALHFSPMASIP